MHIYDVTILKMVIISCANPSTSQYEVEGLVPRLLRHTSTGINFCGNKLQSKKTTKVCTSKLRAEQPFLAANCIVQILG